MVNKLIQAMIMMVIGLALLPVVGDFVDNLTNETDGALAGSTAGTLVELLPVLYVIIIVVGAISYVGYNVKSK